MTSAIRLACALLLGAAACVPYGAGYNDVRSMVKARTGQSVRWNTIDDSDQFSAPTKRLLAAPLTFDAAIKVALLNNSELQAAFAELGIARGELISSMRIPNPEAELRLGLTAAEPTIELTFTEDLTDFIFIPLRKGVADAGFAAAKLRVVGAAMDLAFEARTAFYSFQAEQQILRLRRTVLKTAEASFYAKQRIFDAGNVSELDYLTEKAMYEEARLGHARAETALKVAREQMNVVLGLWGKGAKWTITTQLADPPNEPLGTQEIEQRAVAKSIDLAAAEHRFEAAARRANLSRAEGLIPEIAVGVGIDIEDGATNIGPAVGLRVPLFYQGQGEVSAAKAQMRRQQEMYRGLAVKIRSASRSAAMRLRAARDRALYYKRVILPLRKKLTRETLLHYNAMSLSVIQLLLAKRDEIESSRAYVEALREYWMARAEVQQLLAGRLAKGAANMAMEESGGPARRGGH
jgi:cobalt-zinc-cadmium efflux system outer membrane protein